MAGLEQNLSDEDCLRLATACGAANTQTDGPGLLKKADVDAFYPKVKIKRLK
jgi:fructose-1-phosphate kinase PfkB-like protein